MRFSAGTKLGPYEILSPIGAGIGSFKSSCQADSSAEATLDK